MKLVLGNTASRLKASPRDTRYESGRSYVDSIGGRVEVLQKDVANLGCINFGNLSIMLLDSMHMVG